MTGNLRGKTAIITGAAGGIGFGIAERLAVEGARIVGLDLAAPTEAMAELPGDGQHLAFVVDVSDPDSVTTAFDQVPEIDVLVNSAGTREISTPLELAAAEWNKVIAVNLSGTFFCAQAAARRMAAGGGGSIVNIASIAGLAGFASRPAYSASKAGVLGVTRSLSQDLAEFGIRVNAVCPGLIKTPLTASYFEDDKFVSGLHMSIPMTRPGTIEDVAEAVVWLAGPLSSYVTGTELTIDGGWLAAGTFDPAGGSAYTSKHNLGSRPGEEEDSR
jgi:NAD(P)-dependent dehydrogenase (short-subunit alcohol dehydrogenase family)